MRIKFVLILLCGITLMLYSFRCSSKVSSMCYNESTSDETAINKNPPNYRSVLEPINYGTEDTNNVRDDRYVKPKTIPFEQLRGSTLKGLDFVLDKYLHGMFGYSIINPERTRYGLFEFDEVERMPLQPIDTVYAIVAAKGWQNGKWLPRVYIFWNKLDTIAKDTESNLRMRKETEGKRRTSKTIYSVGNLKDCLSTRLLGTDSLDALPTRYWAPIEDMEDDPNKFVSFAIKMIFKNGVITQAYVTMFYNGGVKLLR